MVERIKELPDIEIDDPSSTDDFHPLPQVSQCLMLVPSGSESERTIVKVLLVNRLDEHDHRPLHYLILEGRYPYRSGLRTSGFRYPYSSYGRRTVAAALRPVQQPSQILAQALGRCLGGHAS